MDAYAKSSGSSVEKAEKMVTEWLCFFKSWVNDPVSTGSILPSGTHLANSMASILEAGSNIRVLELGPGTGAITRAILERGIQPENLLAIEYSRDLTYGFRQKFPGINIIQGDAFDLNTTLDSHEIEKFDFVVSSLPLLNFPRSKRVSLIESLLDRLPHGQPVIQFSYGILPPVPAKNGAFTVELCDWVLLNAPPARVWVYRHQLPDEQQI